MIQTSFLPVKCLYEVDSQFDGVDLKKLARCDDGRDYAIKRIEDGALVPICEWVGYHLWRECGLLTPDFSIVQFDDDRPPAFGSRVELLAKQVTSDPQPYDVALFFAKHSTTIRLCYPLDAFFVNNDRHGRNFIQRPTLAAPELLCFDYSRAWLTSGEPFGNFSSLSSETSRTKDWWQHFTKSMKLKPNFEALEKAQALDADWLAGVLDEAPADWTDCFNKAAVLHYWKTSRSQQAAFARGWLQS